MTMHTGTRVLGYSFGIALSALTLAACGDSSTDTASDSNASETSQQSTTATTTPATSSSSGTSSSGASSSGSQGETSTTVGPGTSTTAGETSSTTVGPGTSSPTTTITTEATTSSETTGKTTGDSGGLCSDEGASCAEGELCCDGLDCCAGVPVPEGQEFCSNNCPISDRNRKRDFAPVDVDEVLERVAALPITTWSYKHQDRAVRHIGPMAQDFKAAFQVGATDRMIFQIDADGVSLAAVQALHKRVEKLDAENAALRDTVSQLTRRLDALEAAAR